MAKGIKTGGRQPGTRNKVTADVKAIAQEHGPSVIAMLAGIALNAKKSDLARIAAGKELLDRAYGKALQGIEMGGPGGGPIQIERVRLNMAPVEELPE